ncbi:hypothetical protein BHE74_00020819 [Ensete ventricosum]|nr:hypothetical protein GW17_00060404 [Ensete ventricosum]RWW71435.1 hypothetical protein BHE74_00020819 [Ensete ventricosum]RZR95826.1 hypothetical protein BHM03_00024722 [Ensete ventricosum]
MGSETSALNALKVEMPLGDLEGLVLASEVGQGRAVGLVLVDIVNGFCTVGAGNLVRPLFQFDSILGFHRTRYPSPKGAAFGVVAPTEPNDQIATMVEEAAKLAKMFSARNWPIFALLDTHHPGKPEPPYPPHCIIGSGEERLVPGIIPCLLHFSIFSVELHLPLLQDVLHYIGLYMAKSRGARIVNKVSLD